MTEPPLRLPSLDPTETNLQDLLPRQRLGGIFTLAATRFRHSGWQHDRERVYDAMIRTEQPGSALAQFRDCGSHAYVLQSIEDPTKFRVAGSTCHHRFCLPCGQQRSRTIALNVLDRLHGKRARFVTLTLRSTTESLSELLAKLSTCFARLRRLAIWAKRTTGGVAFTEVKWNAALSRWNVHLHCITQGTYIKQSLLSKAWKKVTQDSLIVDIRMVRSETHLTAYVTKYASKPLSRTVLLDDDRLDEAMRALKGKRLATTFGDWRGVLLTPKQDEAAWKNLGSLNAIIKAAYDGDPDSQLIYRSLTLHTVHLPEPKPRTRAPPVETIPTYVQASLPLTMIPRWTDPG